MAESRWVKLREYASQIAADLDLGILEEAEIPTLVQGADVGIFGPAYAGPVAHGVTVLVPRDRLDDALDALGVVEEE